MRKPVRSLLIWVVLFAVFFLAYGALRRDEPSPWEDFSTFSRDLEAGDLLEVRVDSNEILATVSSGARYKTVGMIDDQLMRRLTEQGVPVNWGQEDDPLDGLLPTLLVVAAVLGLFVFLLRRMGRAGGANILELRKSRARLIDESSSVTFADVGGCEEAKDLLRDVVQFLGDPEPWRQVGVRPPRGVLLEGPPGCGKTLLARAVAGETEARFFLVAASEFVEMFVGVGAARVRDLFETAAKKPPAVIFIDELDAVGRRRGSGIGAGHDEREQTLNQLLVCLDGFETDDRVVVIGATNRPDILDQALLRPGRIDRRIVIPPLDENARREVLAIHCRDKPLAEDVSLDELATATEGSTGATLETLANEAGLLAVRRARDSGAEVRIVAKDFQTVLDTLGARQRRFDRLDSLLIESATQLSEPGGSVRARLTLLDGAVFEGEVLWADATYIKLGTGEETEACLIPKRQVRSAEALFGTDSVSEVVPDAWAGHRPELA